MADYLKKLGIKESKTRTALTIEKELKEKLEAIAKKENRSLNNLIITILQEYVNKAR